MKNVFAHHDGVLRVLCHKSFVNKRRRVLLLRSHSTCDAHTFAIPPSKLVYEVVHRDKSFPGASYRFGIASPSNYWKELRLPLGAVALPPLHRFGGFLLI